MDWPQVIVAVGTWALVGATLWLVHGQLSTAKEQRKLQLYLELRKDFDGVLVSARKALADQLLKGAPHDDIKETIMNFFEDMGMAGIEEEQRLSGDPPQAVVDVGLGLRGTPQLA
jgi:hypothetical protein